MKRIIKRLLKSIVSPWLVLEKNINWQTNLLRVLIKSFPGYEKKDWEDTFNKNFPLWQRFIELKFFGNFVERDLLIPGANVYIDTWLSNELLKQAPKIRLVQLLISGVEFLDEFDKSADFKITTAAGISSRGVAEHTLLLMLGLARRVDLALNKQNWHKKQREILKNIHELKEQVVGIVGMGNNGRAIASLAKGIGMKVIGVDIRPDLIIEGVEICPGGLDELLSTADFVVLCVPLTKSTRRMIGYEELKKMKKEAYLINVARGEIIDEKALAWALRNGIIKGAALDVLSKEPPPIFNPLRGCPNLIITPHVAGNIHNYHEAIRERFVLNIKAFIYGCPLEGIYNGI